MVWLSAVQPITRDKRELRKKWTFELIADPLSVLLTLAIGFVLMGLHCSIGFGPDRRAATR